MLQALPEQRVLQAPVQLLAELLRIHGQIKQEPLVLPALAQQMVLLELMAVQEIHLYLVVAHLLVVLVVLLVLAELEQMVAEVLQVLQDLKETRAIRVLMAPVDRVELQA